jgi:hypothetical protein
MQNQEALVVTGRPAVNYVLCGQDIPPELIVTPCRICNCVVLLSPEGWERLEQAGVHGFALCTACAMELVAAKPKGCRVQTTAHARASPGLEKFLKVHGIEPTWSEAGAVEDSMTTTPLKPEQA